MSQKLEIKIDHMDFLYTAVLWISSFIFFFWLAYLFSSFSVGKLIVLFLVLGLTIFYIIVYNKRPTVITVDETTLIIKHLFIPTVILLSEIKEITCAPYVHVHGRYHSEQRIKLTILTKDDEYSYNASVNTDSILTNALEDKDTDIPLIRLYRLLKERTCLTD